MPHKREKLLKRKHKDAWLRQSCGIAKLPVELLLEIHSYTGSSTGWMNLRATCRYFRRKLWTMLAEHYYKKLKRQYDNQPGHTWLSEILLYSFDMDIDYQQIWRSRWKFDRKCSCCMDQHCYYRDAKALGDGCLSLRVYWPLYCIAR